MDYAQQVSASIANRYTTISREEADRIVSRNAGLVMAGKFAGDAVDDVAHDLVLLESSEPT